MHQPKPANLNYNYFTRISLYGWKCPFFHSLSCAKTFQHNRAVVLFCPCRVKKEALNIHVDAVNMRRYKWYKHVET